MEEEGISYEMLQDLLRAERRSNKLTPVPARFWQDVRMFLADLEAAFRAEQAKDPFSRRTRLATDQVINSRSAVGGIWALRERKLSMMALAQEDDVKRPQGITPDESDLFDSLNGSLRAGRARILGNSLGPQSPAATPAEMAAPVPTEAPLADPSANAPPLAPTAPDPPAGVAAPASFDDAGEPESTEPPVPESDSTPDATSEPTESVRPPVAPDSPPTPSPAAAPTSAATPASPADPTDDVPSSATPATPAAGDRPDAPVEGAHGHQATETQPPTPPGQPEPERKPDSAPPVSVPSDRAGQSDLVVIRALGDIPPFVGPDMQTYLLKEGDIASVPFSIANLLAKRHRAVIIDD